MGVGYSVAYVDQAAHDPVVKTLNFSPHVKRTRTPLGPIAENEANPEHASVFVFGDQMPPTPAITETARKDERLRREALAQLRGDAVQKAVASQLAEAAASSELNLTQLKRLQAHAQAIASASTAELQSAVAELDDVHERQLERARRRYMRANFRRAESGSYDQSEEEDTYATTDDDARSTATSIGGLIAVQVKQLSGAVDESPPPPGHAAAATDHVADGADGATAAAPQTPSGAHDAAAHAPTPATSQPDSASERGRSSGASGGRAAPASEAPAPTGASGEAARPISCLLYTSPSPRDS